MTATATVSSDWARKRADRVRRALGNPVYFGQVYFAPYDRGWDENKPLPQVGQDMLRFVHTARRGVVILAPEMMKTTLVSQVRPLYLTYRHAAANAMLDLRGMLLSEDEDMASNNLGVISWHMLYNERLSSDFTDANGRPLVYPDPDEQTWNEQAVICARQGASKDPTWQAKGLDSKGIQGRRIKYLIGDDLITPANAFSPAKRKNALDLWDLQITTRLDRDGQAVIVGNFQHHRDLLSELSKRKSYAVMRRPSIHKPGDPETAEPDFDKGELTCPEIWPRDRLEQEREDKPNQFSRIHLLDPKSARGERLKVDWVTLIEPIETPLRYAAFYIALDAAPGGETDDLDFFNITVGAMSDLHLDVIEQIDVRATAPRQVELIGITHDRYQRLGRGVVKIMAGKVSLDAYLRGAVEIARPDLKPKIEPVALPGDKLTRLEGLGAYAQSGWLRVWASVWDALTSDDEDQHEELSLYTQWKDFPNIRHDDKLDGVDVLARGAREFQTVGDREVALEVFN